MTTASLPPRADTAPRPPTPARQALLVAGRHLGALARRPGYILIALVQPVVWLLLFGALFRRVVQIPGFESPSYLSFILPGVLAMAAVTTGGWSGMAMVEDLERGIVDRFLVSPAHRGALVAGRLLHDAVVVTVQSLAIVALALLAGAQTASGVGGLLAGVAVAALLGAAFAALSNALALVTRRGDALVAATNFLLLPLTFLSTAFMQAELLPSWIERVLPFNPLDWGVTAIRSASEGGGAWTGAAVHAGLLLALLAAGVALATASFRVYQRSL